MIDLRCGDCLEVMKEIPDGSVDMILCDLPYGTTACKWDVIIPFDKLWEQYNRIISATGSVVLFASGTFTPMVMMSNIENYKYKWVWVKNHATNFVHAKNRPMSKHEDILVFSKAPMGHKSTLGNTRMCYNPQGLVSVCEDVTVGVSKNRNVISSRPSHYKPGSSYTREYTNYPSDILFFDVVPSQQKVHTSEKPIDLLKYLIRTYTKENGTVLDNCMGSGSTGVACRKTGRSFIGIEKDSKYFAIAKSRIEDMPIITETDEVIEPESLGGLFDLL